MNQLHALFILDKNRLLDKPRWKRFKSLAKREKKLLRIKNQVKFRSCRTSPKYKFTHEKPRKNDYDRGMSIEKKKGNHV